MTYADFDQDCPWCQFEFTHFERSYHTDHLAPGTNEGTFRVICQGCETPFEALPNSPAFISQICFNCVRAKRNEEQMPDYTSQDPGFEQFTCKYCMRPAKARKGSKAVEELVCLACYLRLNK